jgi:hypothetical protein
MMGLRYDTAEARQCGARISEAMRDAAYLASVDLAREKGRFPLFNAEKFLASGFASRLSEKLKSAIAQHGLRNSHLLSIAPTGTISLAFADNGAPAWEPPCLTASAQFTAFGKSGSLAARERLRQAFPRGALVVIHKWLKPVIPAWTAGIQSQGGESAGWCVS